MAYELYENFHHTKISRYMVLCAMDHFPCDVALDVILLNKSRDSIVEPLHTICRDSMGTQYRIIQKISHRGKLISLCSNVQFIFECFMTDKTPSSMKNNCCKSTIPESRWTAEMLLLFVLLLLLLLLLVQDCVTFMTVFTQNSNIFSWAVHNPQLPCVMSQPTTSMCFEPVVQELWL